MSVCVGGTIHDLQLDFGAAKGFHTAFETLMHPADEGCSSLSCALSARCYPDCFLLLLKVSHINPVVYCAQERANPENVTFEAYAFFIQEAKS